MSASTHNIFNILYFPDEILIRIILYLNARERAALGNTCKKFHSLVFEDKKLLRFLDFSQDGRLTTATDIQQYFEDENTSKYIEKVNLRNVHCMKPWQMLNDYIGKASNLVDLNIQGTELGTVRQLGSFLELLPHVERLSIDWPRLGIIDWPRMGISIDVCGVLQQPFSRLKYLSARISACAVEFFRVLEFCQELKELHMAQKDESIIWRGSTTRPKELKNLEIIGFCGTSADWVKKYFSAFLPHPKKWTDFRLAHPLDEASFYLEKDVEICEELLESECIRIMPKSQFLLWRPFKPGFYLCTDSLLKAVIRITQEKVPEEFCSSQFQGGERSALRIEDAKLLLKNPRHRIKYLYLSQSIGTECDVHLLVLASPTLTELYLSDVMKIKKSASKQADFQEPLECRHKMTHWEENYLMNRCLLDSTFRFLVENTPFVEDLTLNGRPGKLEDDEVWDLGALRLICRWTNLRSLRLLSIPISDGEFLIEIGKQCTFLEKLELNHLGSSRACCYTKNLSLMLTHCRNLTNFAIDASNIGLVSDVFNSLAKNLQLKRVRLRSSGEMNNTVDLVSSVEQLLRRCSNLTTFVCIIDGISPALSNQLTSLLRRLRTELNRPTLQFQVVCENSFVKSKVDTVCEDSLPPIFPYTWDQWA